MIDRDTSGPLSSPVSPRRVSRERRFLPVLVFGLSAADLSRTPRVESPDRSSNDMGTTCDEGATFTWVPVTKDSPVDNVRPIVPLWDEHNMVLWFRGTYETAQKYNEEVVGIVITDQ
jgi:hypothetical protein